MFIDVFPSSSIFYGKFVNLFFGLYYFNLGKLAFSLYLYNPIRQS